MKQNVHIVPHFHWDREWYFTAEESKIVLVRDMEEILEMLENNSNYPYFVLDGQTVVLEDYFSVKPENKQRVKNLVKSGKLIIGPWYSQTDEMVVGSESIIRNLLYGKLDCEEFGDIMQIGYLPDSFGQSARMPQILNGFGITRCMFWRGVSERMGTDKTEFYWEDGESKVIIQLLPLGYAIGKYLPTNETELKDRLNKYFSVLDKCATTNNILLPNGHDQMPIQKNIFEVMEKIDNLYPEKKTCLSRYEDVFREIENSNDLATLTGEFLDGKYMRVHRSIFSTRADIKSANTLIENKLTNILEPLMSIAYRLGFPYEHGLLEQIWKEIMKNHAHDSMGCCCSDKVHKIILDRFFIAEERTDKLIDFYKRSIVDAMPCDKSLDKLTFFNLLPYERKSVVNALIVTKMKGFILYDENDNIIPYKLINTQIVDAGLIDRQIVHYGDYDPFVQYTITLEDTFPSCGYKTYFIKEGNIFAKTYKKCEQLENKFYKLTFNSNGTISLLDKKTKVLYNDVLLIEDGSDDGDEYDYSPLENDFIITNKDVNADISVNDFGLYGTASISFDLSIPKDIESRKNKLCDSSMNVKLCVTLKNNSPIIELNVIVDNKAKDHRVRLLFPNNLSTNFSISDNQFGYIKRNVVDSAINVWEEEKWSERPDSIYPFLSYVHCATDTGIAVITNSVREYEIIGHKFDTIAITLFRSVGLLGKEDLFRRPGRPSGIKMETPDSQLIKIQTFNLAFTTNLVEVPTLAKEYLTPIVSYNKMPFNAIKMNSWGLTTPVNFSLLNIKQTELIMSVLKKAEQSNTLLLRIYNPSDRTVTGTVEAKVIELRKLDESIISKCDNNITLNSNEVKTLGIE